MKKGEITMTKIKKVLSLILVFLIISGVSVIFGMTVSAEDDILNYLTYKISDGQVSITGCDKSVSGEVVIPEIIEGYPVTKLVGIAFDSCVDIENIILPESLTYIEGYAFYNCKNLKNIIIPKNVNYIGWNAFYSCESLESILIYGKSTSLGDHAFASCKNLKTVILPDNLKTIDYSLLAFTAIEEITIPESVERIINYAFYNCLYLKSVTIPATVTSIAPYAFGYVHDESTGEAVLMDDFTIYGYSGTAAEEYANKNGITFIDIEDLILELIVKENSTITVTGTVVNLAPQMTVADIVKSVENENVQILNNDGEVITADTLVGTGSKVQVLDKNGNVLSEYDVVIKADVNGDATITAADARLTLRASASLDKIEGAYKLAANYNGDSDITAADARMILRKSAGLE